MDVRFRSVRLPASVGVKGQSVQPDSAIKPVKNHLRNVVGDIRRRIACPIHIPAQASARPAIVPLAMES
jgi:hypothetical protein